MRHDIAVRLAPAGRIRCTVLLGEKPSAPREGEEGARLALLFHVLLRGCGPRVFTIARIACGAGYASAALASSAPAMKRLVWVVRTNPTHVLTTLTGHSAVYRF